MRRETRRGVRIRDEDVSLGPPLGSLAETDGWLADLANPASPERMTAAFVLGSSRRRKRLVRQALRLALSDDDTMVADFAAASLAQLRDIASLPAITRLMLAGPPRDRTGSAWAVCEFGRLADESGHAEALAALRSFHRRARGFSRQHAAAEIERLEKVR